MRLRRNRNGGEEPEDNGEGRPPAEEVEIEITGTEVMRVDTPEVPADPIDPLLEQEEDDEAAELAKRASKTRVNKTVWIMAIVAVVSLGAGIALLRFVISPPRPRRMPKRRKPGRSRSRWRNGPCLRMSPRAATWSTTTRSP